MKEQETKTMTENKTEGKTASAVNAPCYSFKIAGDKGIDLFNYDWRELLSKYEDNHFELAIVDPPYGIGGTVEIGFGDTTTGRVGRPQKWGNKEWEKPTQDYFEELQRVSKNQIIFGGNYFTEMLPETRCWIIWDKVQRINQADAELAWTSFNTSVRIFEYSCSKLQGFMNPNRFHPTEKPVALYRWLLKKYANEGDKILDTHLGSGSIAIACYEEKFDLTACEIDEEYFEAMKKRVEEYRKQLQLF